MKIYNPSLLSTDITGSIRLTNEATASLIGQISSSFDGRYILSGSVSNADWDTLLNKPEGIRSGSVTIETSGSTIYSTNPQAGPNFGTSNNIFLGNSTGLDTPSIELSNYIGFNAGYGSCNSSYSNFIGSSAGYQSNGSYSSNYMGEYAGQLACESNTTNFIGTEAGVQANNSSNSNFIGYVAGGYSCNSPYSNFIGYNVGQKVDGACYSTLIGSYAGFSDESRGSVGRNNIIIGTNITLPTGRRDSINLGGIIFATGSHFGTPGTFSTLLSGSVGNGRVGINVSNPQYALEVSGSVSASMFYGNGSCLSGLAADWNTLLNRPSNVVSSSTDSTTVDFTITNGVITANLIGGVVSGSGQIPSLLPAGVVSGSSQINVTQTTNYNQVVQTSGDQTISGNKTFSNNVIVSGDLSVAGTVNYTTTCNFNVGDNIIELNYGGSATVGGIYVRDASGPSSGSLLWDSNTNKWLIGASGSESSVLTAGGSGVVSGSSQIDHNQTTNYVSNQHIDHSTVSVSAGLGLSGGGNITETRTLTLDTGSTHFSCGVKCRLNVEGVVSGSTQIVSLLPTGTVTGSAQVQINSTTGTLCVNKGGTGQTSYVNGELLIGNTTGNTLTKATLTGTTNQITVTNGAGSITLSTPQSINTAASVQFGSLGIGTTASGTTGEIRATNEITAFYSDDRLKTKLGKIENALQKLKALNGYYFVENETAKSLGYSNDKRQVGVSAQEVQAVLPEVVTTAPISDEYLTVRYEKIVPLLIEAVKEQNNIVETLITEIEELKNTINNRG